MMGHLKIRRDWGFAPDYVDGISRVLRQVSVRAERSGADREADEGRVYRDYILCTGQTHAVWELVDDAFAISGIKLDWDLCGDDPAKWRASYNGTGSPAVVVDPDLIRPSDPLVIEVDCGRARRDLGWNPRQGTSIFLTDMLEADAPPRDR
jgi:GDPmannose 4,6-dehydratase